MNSELSTHGVRRLLESMGAIKPGVRAVAMVATEVGSRRWNLKYPEDQIKSAVEACAGKRGEESYRAFAQALKS